jgi:predicted nucleic acid-binding protein
MRCLLDTNVLSEATKPRPSQALSLWYESQSPENLFVSSITLAEIRFGILQLPEGSRRNALDAWFDGPEGLRTIFSGRVLSFDEAAGMLWAERMADARAKGRPRNLLDCMIAAIAQANHCTLITRNVRDFPDTKVFNPLT